MFSCEVAGRTARWEVNSLMLQRSVRYQQNGTTVPLQTQTSEDKDFGFVIYILSSSSNSRLFSELHVTVVRELNGVVVICSGASAEDHYTDTIQVTVGLVGEPKNYLLLITTLVVTYIPSSSYLDLHAMHVYI